MTSRSRPHPFPGTCGANTTTSWPSRSSSRFVVRREVATPSTVGRYVSVKTAILMSAPNNPADLPEHVLRVPAQHADHSLLSDRPRIVDDIRHATCCPNCLRRAPVHGRRPLGLLAAIEGPHPDP